MTFPDSIMHFPVESVYITLRLGHTPVIELWSKKYYEPVGASIVHPVIEAEDFSTCLSSDGQYNKPSIPLFSALIDGSDK